MLAYSLSGTVKCSPKPESRSTCFQYRFKNSTVTQPVISLSHFNSSRSINLPNSQRYCPEQLLGLTEFVNLLFLIFTWYNFQISDSRYFKAKENKVRSESVSLGGTPYIMCHRKRRRETCMQCIKKLLVIMVLFDFTGVNWLTGVRQLFERAVFFSSSLEI